MKRFWILMALVNLIVDSGAANSLWDESFGFRRTVLVSEIPSNDNFLNEAVVVEVRDHFASSVRFNVETNQAKVEGNPLFDPKTQTWNLSYLSNTKTPFDSLLWVGKMEVASPKKVLLKFVWLSIQQPAVQFSEFLELAEPIILSDLRGKIRNLLKSLEDKVPFDATILSRDGYHVTLDAGFGAIRSGQKIRVFTWELEGSKLELRETGIILINQVNKNIAFGQVILEKFPQTVSKNNKILFQNGSPSVIALDPPRKIAALGSFYGEMENSKRSSLFAYGSLTAGLGTGFLTLKGFRNDLDAALLAPELKVHGDLWLTKDYGVESFVYYGEGSVDSGTENSLRAEYVNLGFNVIRRQSVDLGSFRFHLFAKLGYHLDRSHLATGSNVNVSDLSMSGIFTGLDMVFPIQKRYGLFSQIGTYFLLSASKITGRQDVQGKTYHYLMNMGAYYQLYPNMELHCVLEHFNGGVSGEGFSVGATQNKFAVGVRHFF